MTRTASSQAQSLGRVLQWDAAKGLGFVQSELDGARLLLRRADLDSRWRGREPQVGETLRFRPSHDGRRATRASPLASPSPPAAAAAPRSARAASSRRLLVVPAFALLLGLLHLQQPLPRPVPVLYGALSTALFLVYGIDKWAARRGSARVANASLHLIALMGGWPGALLAQHIFRHKTAQPAFLRLTWAMAALNISLLLLAWTLLRP